MEPIISYLQRELTNAGRKRWVAIAAQVSEKLPATKRFTSHSLRKIVYGERDNLGLMAAQALLDYFQRVERGEMELPEESDSTQEAA